MGDYRLPWEPKPLPTKKYPARPGPKPGSKHFIGPIAPNYGSGYQTPSGAPYKTGMAPKPSIPFNLGTVGRSTSNNDNNDNNNNTNTGSSVKVVNPSNFVENIVKTDPDYAAESLVAFNNLTTIEILEVSRSGNVSVDARNLNPNILDIVSVANTFSPTEIIKLQTTLDTFFSPFEENLAENSFDITTIPGIAEVKIPQKNDNNLAKTQIQVLAPKKIHRDTIYI